MNARGKNAQTALRAVALYAGIHAVAGVFAGIFLSLFLAEHPGAKLSGLLAALPFRLEEIHPGILADVVRKAGNIHLGTAASFFFLYALCRGIECFGLWRPRRWGEIYSACTAGIFLPLEIDSVLRKPGWLNSVFLLANSGIVFFMIRALRKTALLEKRAGSCYISSIRKNTDTENPFKRADRRELPMYSAADLKKGLKIEIDGDPYLITDFEFCKPGKGTALYRCKLKNMLTGSTMDRTFRPVDKVGKPDMEERELYFSYQDGENYVFSDAETYEELPVSKDNLGNRCYFLIEGALCSGLFFNGKLIDITLPTFIEKVVTETEPGARGDTASSNVMKPAKIDNGYELAVPLFINAGDTIRIDTRTGGYSERVTKG